MTAHDKPPSGTSAERYPDRESPLADVAADTRAEMDFHIQTRADLYVRDGMTPEAALARTRAEFGDRERALARCVTIGQQQERRRRLLDSVGALPQDARYALRRLAASPGFTVAAVVTLALGIGANSAIFSVVNGVLLRPLPFADADRLAMIWNDNRRLGMRTDITSWATFEDWRAESRSFASMAGFTHRGVNLGGDFEPERLAAAAVSVEFFDVLGVRPASGRAFTREEMAPGAAPVAILSHGVAAQRLGSARDAVGRMVRLNGTETKVVGVMPAGFNFPADAAVWTPLQISDDLRQARGAFFLYVVGRLTDGVTFEQAQAEMDGVAAALEQAYPQGIGYGIFVQPVRTHLVGDVRPAILVLLGAVGLVLLIACANVASLLLARATARQREMAVRVALGAGRSQLIRQLLTESVTIALAGGSLGLLLAYGGVRLLRTTAPADLPRLDEITVDPTVLGFTLALSLLTGMLFGFVPALHASRKDLTRALNDENRSSVGAPSGWRTRGALMVAELATSLILLIGTALLVQSFLRVSRLDSGFDGRGVLTARVVLTGSSYEEPNAVLGFYDRLFERLRALPNVERVAAGTDVFLAELPNSGSISVEGEPREPAEQRIEVTGDVITPGYFQAIGTPLLLGRDVGPEDRENSVPVAVVNQAMVRRYWPDEDPLGKRFKFGSPENDNPWITVVGVVADARRTAPEREARPSAYVPHRQRPRAGMMLIIRSSDDPLRLAGAVRAAVQELDPHQPVSELATLESLLAERLAQRRLTTLLAGIFSVVAILLALVGVYGVLSYAVAQSTREIGVRMALGAQVADVMGMVFRKATWLLATGLTLGLLGALLMTRALASLLYGIDPLDPLTFAVAPVLVAAAALLACYLPARRATRIDPVVALRAEG